MVAPFLDLSISANLKVETRVLFYNHKISNHTEGKIRYNYMYIKIGIFKANSWVEKYSLKLYKYGTV